MTGRFLCDGDDDDNLEVTVPLIRTFVNLLDAFCVLWLYWD